MNDFNLLISTGRTFEKQAETEIWFNCLAMGDENPIISVTPFQGLLWAKIGVESRNFIKFLRERMKNQPDFIQFILKVQPVDRSTETDIDIIVDTALDLVKIHPISSNPDTTFRVSVKRRHSEISTSELINTIADKIPNKVNLQDFDWNLHIEILGSITGIAVLKQDDIFKPISELREIRCIQSDFDE